MFSQHYRRSGEPSAQEDPDLLKQADAAMYAAKRSGKNRAVHFSSELGLMARERLTLENELRGALGRNEIYVDYQPEFNIKSGRLVRFEALARWRHPHLGDIAPANFIPIAEECGLIHSLGEFVMEHACRRCLNWQSLSAAPVQVAVNASALQVNSDSFVDAIRSVLNRTLLPPDLLQIELTEVIVEGIEEEAQLEMIRRMGADDAQGYLLGRPSADPELLLTSFPGLEGKLTDTSEKLAVVAG